MQSLPNEIQMIIFHRLISQSVDQYSLFNNLISWRSICSTFNNLLYTSNPRMFFNALILKELLLGEALSEQLSSEPYILSTTKLMFVVFFSDESKSENEERTILKNVFKATNDNEILHEIEYLIGDEKKAFYLKQMFMNHSEDDIPFTFIIRLLLSLSKSFNEQGDMLLLSVLALFLKLSSDNLDNRKIDDNKLRNFCEIKKNILIVVSLSLNTKYFSFLFSGLKLSNFSSTAYLYNFKSFNDYRLVLIAFRFYFPKSGSYSIAKQNFSLFIEHFNQKEVKERSNNKVISGTGCLISPRERNDDLLNMFQEESTYISSCLDFLSSVLANEKRRKYLRWMKNKICLLIERLTNHITVK